MSKAAGIKRCTCRGVGRWEASGNPQLQAEALFALRGAPFNSRHVSPPLLTNANIDGTSTAIHHGLG
jgi:hypothetical protein